MGRVRSGWVRFGWVGSVKKEREGISRKEDSVLVEQDEESKRLQKEGRG